MIVEHCWSWWQVAVGGGLQNWTSEVVARVGRQRWSPESVVEGGCRNWTLEVATGVGCRRWSPELSNKASMVIKVECTIGGHGIKCR